MKTAIIGCGLMGTGIASLTAGSTELLLIDLDAGKAQTLAQAYHGSWSVNMDAAKDADIVAVVLPAPAIEPAMRTLSAVVKPGTIVLDMATKGIIPADVIHARPEVSYLEAKIIGAGVGVSYGLKAMLVVGTEDPQILSTLRSVFPGFSNIVSGDPFLVPQINSKGAYYGIRAAVETELALKQMGIPNDWISSAIGCLVPGSTVGYAEGRMGRFNAEIAEKLKEELDHH